MEYYVRNGRRRIAPWVWILIVLLAVILIFVVWWAVAAQSPERTVVVPGQEQPAMPPAQQPAQQPPAQPAQPQVIERPVTIYVERGERPSTVYVVPRDEQPPQATERLRQIDIPGEFSYQERNWQPSNEAVMSDNLTRKDTGATVAGNKLYALADDQPPYDSLYLETEPGSGVYVKYEPM